ERRVDVGSFRDPVGPGRAAVDDEGDERVPERGPDVIGEGRHVGLHLRTRSRHCVVIVMVDTGRKHAVDPRWPARYAAAAMALGDELGAALACLTVVGRRAVRPAHTIAAGLAWLPLIG